MAKKTSPAKAKPRISAAAKGTAKKALPKTTTKKQPSALAAEIIDPSEVSVVEHARDIGSDVRSHDVDPADELGLDVVDADDVAERAKAEAAEWEARGWSDEASRSLDPDREPTLEEIAAAASKAGAIAAREDAKSGAKLPAKKKAQALPASTSTALTAADPITLYMNEVKKYKLLTREEEQTLARRYRETGDPRAAEQLVTSNLRFVVKIAAEYSKFGARLIDLIQEGNIGLMHGVREFNPYKGVRLITYAVWWIRGYIQDYLMRQYSLVRIGTTQAQRKLFYRLQKEKDLLESMGQESNVKLLSARLGVSEEDVESMTQRMKGRDVSLSQTIDESGKTTLLDLEATDEMPVDERMGNEEMLSLLRDEIEHIRDSLNPRELQLLEERLLADEPLTLQEIGEKYGVTREAVRQMEARLMAKIRDQLKARLSLRDRTNVDS